MAYIGIPAVDRFTSTKAASVYSGNGSTVAFTLEHAVGSDEDILVSVDGVIQEPSVAYAVSSGTTLTFDDAPSSNSGNNIFVYYLFSTLGTVAHPTTSALSATSGTFSTTLGVTGNATLAGTLAVTGTSTLTGVTALGNTSSTVKSEGGAVTTNIAQGLAKSWVNMNGTGTIALRDSFNVSGISDSGGGDYVISITNDMANAHYTLGWNQQADTTPGESCFVGLRSASGTPTTKLAGSYRGLSVDQAGNISDMQQFGCMVAGDLA